MKIVAVVFGLAALFSICSRQQAASAEEADRYCRMFLETQHEMSESRGEHINKLTAFAGIDVRCPEKVVDFRQAVLAPGDKLKSGWKERLEARWSSAYCKAGSESLEAVRNGWTIATTITTSDGAEFRVKAICADGIAAPRPGADSDRARKAEV